MMNEKFMELMKMKAKKHGMMSDKDKMAKMGLMDEFDSVLNDVMGDKVKNLKKVTIASDSEEGLKEGLEKAEDVLEEKEESSMMEKEDEESEEESSDVESEIAMLKEKLAKLEAMKKA